MALDRQINLFKVDTNAFLTEEEKEHRKYLVKLKKVREKIRKRLPKYNKKENEKDKNIIKKKIVQGEDVTKYEQWFLVFEDKIAEEEKIWKEYILENCR